MINVLIVDDSSTLRHLIRHILEMDSDLTVIGEAADGEEAIRMVRRNKPDVITMDIEMPGMGGYKAIQQIMTEAPTPIIVLTSMESNSNESVTFKGVEAGALMVMKKPGGLAAYDEDAAHLVRMIKAMSDVKVVRRRWHRTPAGQKTSPSPPVPGNAGGVYQIVAVGTSTGGPPALRAIFEPLPATLPVPIVVVQHISKGFTDGLARWLNETVDLKVKVGVHRETLCAGTVYLAPDDMHMRVTGDKRISLHRTEPLGGHRPSVTVLFQSVAENFASAAMGVLLTGMGKDGASGLRDIRAAGGYTAAQDRETSVVFGMPGEAVALEAACDVLPLEQIGRKILSMMRNRATPYEIA